MLRSLSATIVSLSTLFTVPGAAIIAAVALGETPPPASVPALLLLLAGTALVISARSRAIHSSRSGRGAAVVPASAAVMAARASGVAAQFGQPALEFCDAFSEAAEGEDRAVIPKLEAVHDLYFGGNLEASFAFSGQVAGRIEEVRPVAEILRDTVAECEVVLRETSARYG